MFKIWIPTKYPLVNELTTRNKRVSSTAQIDRGSYVLRGVKRIVSVHSAWPLGGAERGLESCERMKKPGKLFCASHNPSVPLVPLRFISTIVMHSPAISNIVIGLWILICIHYTRTQMLACAIETLTGLYLSKSARRYEYLFYRALCSAEERTFFFVRQAAGKKGRQNHGVEGVPISSELHIISSRLVYNPSPGC